LVLKGSGVADERTKYSFYYFHNWKFAHQKNDFLCLKDSSIVRIETHGGNNAHSSRSHAVLAD
jgi:hypothetical protein